MTKEKLLFESKAFCVLPWVHLHIQGNGEIKPCCVANTSIGRVNDDSLKENLENSSFLQELKENLLTDVRHSACTSCYQREDGGSRSIRQESNEKYQHLVEDILAGKEKFPVYWDVRFSNLCNLKCRTCWHGNSSQWFEEAQLLRRNISDKSLIYLPHQDKVLNELIENIDEVEEVYFAGGEPLLMKEHYQLLATLLNKRKTKVRLRYNTNFTTFSYQDKSIFDYWKQFKKVEVLASLDASGERGEYLRKNLSWNKVLEMRKEMLEKVPHVDFKLAPTISALNVWHFPDFHQEWIEKGLIQVNDVYINILEYPAFFNMKVLPTTFKEEIQEKYRKHFDYLRQKGNCEEVIERLEEVLHYLFSESWEGKIKKLQKELHLLDELRGEEFSVVFPELKIR